MLRFILRSKILYSRQKAQNQQIYYERHFEINLEINTRKCQKLIIIYENCLQKNVQLINKNIF